RWVSSSWGLCRSHPQGREACGFAGRAVKQVRTRHQRLDRQDARPHRAGQTARGRRRGDRMNQQPRAHLEQQLEECRRELAEAREQLAEAREQQTATSEVLKVISVSLGELEPVLQSMLANAMRICDAKFGIIFEYSDGTYRSLSSLGVPQQYDEHCRQKRVWGPDTLLGQVART